MFLYVYLTLAEPLAIVQGTLRFHDNPGWKPLSYTGMANHLIKNKVHYTGLSNQQQTAFCTRTVSIPHCRYKQSYRDLHLVYLDRQTSEVVRGKDEDQWETESRRVTRASTKLHCDRLGPLVLFAMIPEFFVSYNNFRLNMCPGVIGNIAVASTMPTKLPRYKWSYCFAANSSSPPVGWHMLANVREKGYYYPVTKSWRLKVLPPIFNFPTLIAYV